MGGLLTNKKWEKACITPIKVYFPKRAWWKVHLFWTLTASKVSTSWKMKPVKVDNWKNCSCQHWPEEKWRRWHRPVKITAIDKSMLHFLSLPKMGEKEKTSKKLKARFQTANKVRSTHLLVKNKTIIFNQNPSFCRNIDSKSSNYSFI